MNSISSALPLPDRWHRPLVVVAAAMGGLVLVTGVAAVVDPREILGQNAWFKPMKFAISLGLYAITIAWMIGQLRRWRRVADIAGTVTAVAIVAEIVIITGAAAAGTTSHFNVTTPLNSTLWVVMGASIAALWIAGLAAAVALVLNPTPDRARTLAVRAGVGIGLIGMAVAFFMTGPTEAQLDDFEGIVGAHAVGVPDGGAGLPFFGWSTEGGDLRVPHFVGMHALQLLPLGVLGLELAGRRIRVLRDARLRLELVAVASVALLILLGLLTGQALAGQSVVAPAGGFLLAGVVLAAATFVGVVAVFVRGHARVLRAPTAVSP
ncbi:MULTISPECIES: hypothetical protein [Microbacterium]|uniref:hypothetical protein n=1 Tax=Microbacterium TaxID=33882 RepID=UPI00278A9794|nr:MULTISPECIES: hypothetical protein [Microbacterium]MDQ1082402.1 vacuolar-type H+-ATPase subunit I/STV1 [Microbacterium sp. SORGH_AS_0344]MDQ1168827.1 vacuolar-type H+-ATPase subunit I/STV1 [Microbacterium proteolyticum]